MPKYQGYVIRKEYFKVEVEADTLEDAKDLIGDAEINDKPVDMDWEIYDIEEIENV
jgi:hypothetical protein